MEDLNLLQEAKDYVVQSELNETEEITAVEVDAIALRYGELLTDKWQSAAKELAESLRQARDLIRRRCNLRVIEMETALQNYKTLTDGNPN